MKMDENTEKLNLERKLSVSASEVKTYFNETIIGEDNCSTIRYFSPCVSDLEIDKLTEKEIDQKKIMSELQSSNNTDNTDNLTPSKNFENFMSIYNNEQKQKKNKSSNNE